MNGVDYEQGMNHMKDNQEALETVVVSDSNTVRHKNGSATSSGSSSKIWAIPMTDRKHVEDQLMSERTASQMKTYSANGGGGRTQKVSDATNIDLNSVISERINSASKKPGAGIYFEDGKRRIDFVLVFEPNGSTEKEAQRRMFEDQLLEEGLEIERDMAEGMGFLKIHAPWEVLCTVGSQLQMRVPVCINKDDDDQDYDGSRNKNWLEKRFHLNESDAALLPQIQRYFTAPFDDSRLDHYLIGDTDRFFSTIQRVQIVWDILQHIPIADPASDKQQTTGKLFAVTFSVKRMLNTVQKNSTSERPPSKTGTESTTDSGPNSPPTRRTEPLRSAPSEGLVRRGVEWLLEEKVYLAAFPLHDGPDEVPKDSDSNWSQRQVQ